MRAHGIDISKWQINFFPPASPPLPIDFCIQRTGYGMVQDERYEDIWIGVQQVPIRGAYHYFSSAANWKDQADKFLEVQSKHDYHFYALDVEIYYNKKSEGFWRGAKRWIDYVAKTTDKKVLLYTNPNVYKTWLLPYGDWMKGYPLWIAQYWWVPKPTNNPGMKSTKRTDWLFYQYTDKANGKGYGVLTPRIDVNVFNGTIEKLQEWAGTADKPDVEPPITPIKSANLHYENARSAMNRAIDSLKD